MLSPAEIAGRTGVELMTAWVGSDRNNDFPAERVRALLDEADSTTDKLVALSKAVAGMGAVAGELLLLLARVTERTEEEVLRRSRRNSSPRINVQYGSLMDGWTIGSDVATMLTGLSAVTAAATWLTRWIC